MPAETTSPRVNRYLRDIPLPGLSDLPSGYRGPAVCKAVGISYRQLDYWTATGLVTASVQQADGSGTQRLYSVGDMLVMKVAKTLLDMGISLNKVRRIVDHVRDRNLRLSESVIAVGSDGITVYGPTEKAEQAGLTARDMAEAGGVSLIIDCPAINEQVERVAHNMPSERAQPVPRLSYEEVASSR